MFVCSVNSNLYSFLWAVWRAVLICFCIQSCALIAYETLLCSSASVVDIHECLPVGIVTKSHTFRGFPQTDSHHTCKELVNRSPNNCRHIFWSKDGQCELPFWYKLNLSLLLSRIEQSFFQNWFHLSLSILQRPKWLRHDSLVPFGCLVTYSCASASFPSYEVGTAVAKKCGGRGRTVHKYES